MRVSDRMTAEPSSVRPDHTLAAVKALMDAEGIRHIPVAEEGRLVGILTDRDLQRHWGYLDSTLVNAAMVQNPVTVAPEATIEDATRLLISHRIRALPVVEGSRLVGIITTTDLLKALLEVVNPARLGSPAH